MNDDALPAAVVLQWCLHGSRARSRSLNGDLKLDLVFSYTILLVLLFTVLS